MEKQNLVSKIGSALGVSKWFNPPTSVEVLNNGENFYEIFGSAHEFKLHDLNYLLNTGYYMNPIVFGIVNRITLASSNLKLIPYKNGKPLNEPLKIDLPKLLNNLCTTGSSILYKYKPIGFDYEFRVIETINIVEEFYMGEYKYYEVVDGKKYTLEKENLSISYIHKIANGCTNLGLSPLQAAIMPIESLKEMYQADTSLLKNKGADILVSNGTDMPMTGTENGNFDDAFNKRLAGAKKLGRAITSSAKVDVHQLGRTTKELALWDGYKIKLRDICIALNTDSAIFNDPDNKKFSNVGEAEKALYTGCVIPLSRNILESEKLLNLLGVDEIFIDTSLIECLQQSQKERFEKNLIITDAIINLNAQIKGEIISRDVALNIMETEWGFDKEEASKYLNVS